MTLPLYEEPYPGEEDSSGGLGDMEEPEPFLPCTDTQTARLVEEAVDALAWARSHTTPVGDPRLRLLCLVSLMAEAEAGTYEYVAQAYEAGYSWGALAWATGDLLGDLESTYGPYIEWRAAQDGTGSHKD